MWNAYENLIFTPKRLFLKKFNSRLISQNISRLLWNMTFQFRIHKNSTTDSTWARWIHVTFWNTSFNLTFSVSQTIFMHIEHSFILTKPKHSSPTVRHKW